MKMRLLTVIMLSVFAPFLAGIEGCPGMIQIPDEATQANNAASATDETPIVGTTPPSGGEATQLPPIDELIKKEPIPGTAPTPTCPALKEPPVMTLPCDIAAGLLPSRTELGFVIAFQPDRVTASGLYSFLNLKGASQVEDLKQMFLKKTGIDITTPDRTWGFYAKAEGDDLTYGYLWSQAVIPHNCTDPMETTDTTISCTDADNDLKIYFLDQNKEIHAVAVGHAPFVSWFAELDAAGKPTDPLFPRKNAIYKALSEPFRNLDFPFAVVMATKKPIGPKLGCLLKCGEPMGAVALGAIFSGGSVDATVHGRLCACDKPFVTMMLNGILDFSIFDQTLTTAMLTKSDPVERDCRKDCISTTSTPRTCEKEEECCMGLKCEHQPGMAANSGSVCCIGIGDKDSSCAGAATGENVPSKACCSGMCLNGKCCGQEGWGCSGGSDCCAGLFCKVEAQQNQCPIDFGQKGVCTRTSVPDEEPVTTTTTDTTTGATTTDTTNSVEQP